MASREVREDSSELDSNYDATANFDLLPKRNQWDSDSDSDLPLPRRNQLLSGSEGAYAVGREIARGRFGAIYEVLRRRDGKRFAAKLEIICDSASRGIDMEYAVMRTVKKKNTPGLIALVDRGKIENHFKFIVMNLLGDDLEKIRHSFVELRYSSATALRLARLTLECIRSLHGMGFVHRDIKASNFVVVPTQNKDDVRVCLIDFGVCRHFEDKQGGRKPARQDKSGKFRGTTRYASLAAHRREELSTKDDVESWFYSLVEWTSSSLPWSRLGRRSERDQVQRLKEEARTGDALDKFLDLCPKAEYYRILQHIDEQTYETDPDYDFLFHQIQQGLESYGLTGNETPDWIQ